MDSVPESVKRCPQCGDFKAATLEYFYRDDQRKNNLRPLCKTCMNNREILKRSVKADLNKRNKLASEYYEAVNFGRAFKICTRCGGKKNAVLEYFHYKDTGKFGLSSVCKACKNAYGGTWAKANPERSPRHNKNWRESNRDKGRASCRNRRARAFAAEGVHTAEDVRKQYALQCARCYWCGCKLVETGPGRYHADHREPLSKGGSNGPENIVCACPNCNCSKGKKSPFEFAGRVF